MVTDPITKGLKTTARDALLECARLLADGYTGKLELQCNQGGVRNLRKTENVAIENKKT